MSIKFAKFDEPSKIKRSFVVDRKQFADKELVLSKNLVFTRMHAFDSWNTVSHYSH